MEFFKRWSLTGPLLCALLAALIYGNAEKAHSRLLQLGEHLFTGYFELQQDPTPPPNCDELEKNASKEEESEDDELLDDLFAGDEDEQVEDQARKNDATQKAIKLLREKCEAQHTKYKEIQSRITPNVLAFRVIERGAGSFVSWVVDHFKHILVLILIFGSLSASVGGHHIALRSATSKNAARFVEVIQLAAFSLLFASNVNYRNILTAPEERTLNLLWLIGLVALSVTHLYRAVYLPTFRHESKSSTSHDNQIITALLSVPLFSIMALIAGGYFLLVGHYSGLAIELTKLTEHAILYVHVALYVWVGMLLKQSPLTQQVFGVLRPWKFNPALLTALVVIGAAIPTAYSGASGIFVIAAGALIYEELRKAGARRQLALAATAMSGSLGVVLSPCLLIVIIASLNKEVTTDELYGWGLKAFFLTSGLFALLCIVQRDRSQPWVGSKSSEAWPLSKQVLKDLLPGVLLASIALIIYWLLLDAKLDEHSAPMMLPVILLSLLGLSKRRRELPSFKKAVSAATAESSTHIGALLALMGLSICLGGVIERAEIMSLFPQTFGSLWLAMSALVIILVLIGMSMDPYGAVILVSATIADVAYANGINPVHFWVVVMVAFELGYLSPPVALNHLLTRQVVGDHEVELATQEGTSFIRRYERVIMPVMVMGISLILVAFIPLFFY